MKAVKNKKVLAAIILVAVIMASFTTYLYWRHTNEDKKCPYTACASGDNCVAPNDAIVNCEELRKNPTKTDWIR